MTSDIGNLLALAKAPPRRLALASMLGALTVVFGLGLMGSAGYLISRSAERPAVLSLMVTIVAVQFFGLGRPVARYLERIASHDLALRVLGRVRARESRAWASVAGGLDGPRRARLPAARARARPSVVLETARTR